MDGKCTLQFFQKKVLKKTAESLSLISSIVNAKNSDFMDDCAIRAFFLNFHEMAALPMVKTKLSVDLHSLDSKYQLASE